MNGWKEDRYEQAGKQQHHWQQHAPLPAPGGLRRRATGGVAAAQRAKVSIEEFDGAPAVREALEIMVYCYDQMGLKELAAQTRQMYRNNYEGEVGENKGPAKKK